MEYLATNAKMDISLKTLSALEIAKLVNSIKNLLKAVNHVLLVAKVAKMKIHVLIVLMGRHCLIKNAYVQIYNLITKMYVFLNVLI